MPVFRFNTVPTNMSHARLRLEKVSKSHETFEISLARAIPSIRAFFACFFVFALTGCIGLEQGGFEGRATIGFEAERKTCISCDETEHENELETTPIEMVFQPKGRPDLSLGFEVKHDIESEGDFFGSGRTDFEDRSAVSVWTRRKFNETYWGRMQAELDFTEKYLEFGGRAGLDMDLANDREFSAYINADRRVKTASDSSADEGTYLEVRAEHEWDWDEYGAWVEVKADRWFYSGDAKDGTRLTLEPGVSFDLGDSPHKGLVWLEGERRTRKGPENFRRDTLLTGLGAEFDLGRRRELLLGVTFGKERETETGAETKKTNVRGLFTEFQFRF